jgi:hypothetical protein
MATQTATRAELNQAVAKKILTRPEDDAAEKKIQELRQLYADAPEIGRVALENLIDDMKAKAKAGSGEKASTAGRIGLQKGKVSELTTLLPLVPGGAERIRAVLDAGGNLQNADKVGTLHDMRYVFLDNDTKLLFATTYDGDWDAYINDFATFIPDDLDVVFANCVGWPGVRSPAVKDYIVKHQIPAHAWYVGNPNLTVKDARRLEKIGAALDEFLDKIA